MNSSKTSTSECLTPDPCHVFQIKESTGNLEEGEAVSEVGSEIKVVLSKERAYKCRGSLSR